MSNKEALTAIIAALQAKAKLYSNFLRRTQTPLQTLL